MEEEKPAEEAEEPAADDAASDDSSEDGNVEEASAEEDVDEAAEDEAASDDEAAEDETTEADTLKPPKKATDDLFGASAQPQLREWVDITGQHKVEARLVAVFDGKVRLLKTTGRTTTVAISTLSPADQRYVAKLIAQRGPGPVEFAVR
jgi:hypothetical protein